MANTEPTKVDPAAQLAVENVVSKGLMAYIQGGMKSKTVWSAAVIGVLATVQTALPSLQLYLTQQTFMYIGLTITVLMIGLRAITTDALYEKAVKVSGDSQNAEPQ